MWPSRSNRKSFQEIISGLHRKSFKYITSLSSAPTQAYLSTAGLTNVVNKWHNGSKRKVFPVQVRPTSNKFRNFPRPFVRSSLSVEANTTGCMPLFFRTSRAYVIQFMLHPCTQSPFRAAVRRGRGEKIVSDYS